MPVLLGALLALTLPPFPLGFALPFVLAAALGGRGFRYGLLLGLGFWGVHLAWLPASFLARFGPFGLLPGVLLIATLASFFGLLFAFFGGRPFALAGAWVLFEWLLAYLPWPFPWGYLGYAAADGGVRVLAAWVGVNGLSLLALLLALVVWRGRYVAGLLWALLWFLPLPNAAPEGTALLVQAAIDPLEKSQGTDATARYLDLTEGGLAEHPAARLVVWPETAVFRLPRAMAAVLGDRSLIYGTWGPGPRNEVRLFAGGRDRAAYAKRRLVPFGEYFPGRAWLEPLYEAVFTRLGLPELVDLVPGEQLRPLGPYAAFICFEADFPGDVRRLARGARLLVNVSNDGWFGIGYGRRQHLTMSRMRAVENGLWLLRAANDGISASVDPYGNVRASTPEGVPAVLAAPYALGVGGRTLFSRTGELPVLGAAYLLTILGLLGSGAKTAPPHRGRAGPGGSLEAEARRRKIAARARPPAGRRRG